MSFDLRLVIYQEVIDTVKCFYHLLFTMMNVTPLREATIGKINNRRETTLNDDCDRMEKNKHFLLSTNNILFHHHRYHHHQQQNHQFQHPQLIIYRALCVCLRNISNRYSYIFFYVSIVTIFRHLMISFLHNIF